MSRAVWSGRVSGFSSTRQAPGRPLTITSGVTAWAAAEPVAPGAGLAPLETFLRSRGALDLADRLREGLLDTDRKMAAIDPGDEATLSAATAALERLKRLVEVDAAPALQVRIGFSDADGD